MRERFVRKAGFANDFPLSLKGSADGEPTRSRSAGMAAWANVSCCTRREFRRRNVAGFACGVAGWCWAWRVFLDF